MLSWRNSHIRVHRVVPIHRLSSRIVVGVGIMMCPLGLVPIWQSRHLDCSVILKNQPLKPGNRSLKMSTAHNHEIDIY